MSFGFLVAGFLAASNAGRVGLAAQNSQPGDMSRALALLIGVGLVAAATVFADDLLDGLAISPESFRIAAGLVLAALGLRTIAWPEPMVGPFAAVLVTPELTCLAISFGADEPTGRVLGAFAIALPLVVLAAHQRRREPLVLGAQFLAALQLVVAVALVVSGIRDV
jgi:small neutral amino acid transporter SnatA (MarC family)